MISESLCHRPGILNKVWIEEGMVYKATKYGYCERVISDYETFRKGLGQERVAPTFFDCDNGRVVLLAQPFIRGIPVEEYVKKNGGMGNYGDFMERSMEIYYRTKRMPDLFGRPHFVGWYDPIRTPNVLVADGVPILVDVVVSRMSDRGIIGWCHNKMLEMSIRRLIN